MRIENRILDRYMKLQKNTYTAPDGATFQTHWVENVRTGETHDIKPSNISTD